MDMIGSLLGGEKPARAQLAIFTDGLEAEPEILEAQFNPSEYSITRGVKTNDQGGASKEPQVDSQQTVQASLAVLSVSLFFDSYTDLSTFGIKDVASAATSFAAGGMSGIGQGVKTLAGTIIPEPDPLVSTRCLEIATALKFAAKTHDTPWVDFIWGNMTFRGKIQNTTINYTMFTEIGHPVRMKISLDIKGEQADVIKQQKSMPHESPDRTKECFLQQGDQMWMLAANEYKDPSKWKVIAKANGILNPRAINKGIRLKVPSIQ